jgi:exonuclease III
VSEDQIKTELDEDVLPGYKAYWCSSVTKKGYSGTVSIILLFKAFIIFSLTVDMFVYVFINVDYLYVQAVFVNKSTFGATGSAAAAAAPAKGKTKKLTDFFGAPAAKAPAAAPAAPAEAVAAPASKGVVLRTEFDLEGTKHAGEGRTIMLELDTFFLVACYVPNSGQNLERLDYRVDEWFVRLLLLLILLLLLLLPLLLHCLFGMYSANASMTYIPTSIHYREPDMRAYLKHLSATKPVVYTGDLNVAHLDLDIYNFDAKHIAKQSGCTPRERAAFGTMLEAGFVDAFRHYHPGKRWLSGSLAVALFSMIMLIGVLSCY